MEKVGEFSDFLTVNLLYVLCCLPGITVGAASCALYAEGFSFIEHGDMSGRSFLKNLVKQLGVGIGSIILGGLMGSLLMLNMYWALLFQFPGWFPLLFFWGILLLFMLLMLPQMFLFQAKFQCSYRMLLKNAVRVTVAHPLRAAVAAVALYSPVLCFVFFPGLFTVVGLLFVTFYFSLVGYFSAKIMMPIYHKYIQNMEKPGGAT